MTFLQFCQIWLKQQDLALPSHHRQIIDWLYRYHHQPNTNLLLQAFRNAGKSTLVALYAVWNLYQNPNLRILILAAEENLASKMSQNIRDIIENHPHTTSFKPDKPRNWSRKALTINRSKNWRDPSVEARGIMGNLTGYRADLIICDDIEVPRNSATPRSRNQLAERVGELSFIKNPGGKILVIGTPHCRASLYRDPKYDEQCADAAFNPLADAIRLTIPLLNDDGISIWPDRFDQASIAALKKQTGLRRFAAQMLLQPLDLDEIRLNPAHLHKYDRDLRYHHGRNHGSLWLGEERIHHAICWWDPAFAENGDGSVIAYVLSDGSGQAWLHKLHWLEKTPPAGQDGAAWQCQQVIEMIKKYHIPAIMIEINGVGKLLPELLRQNLRQAGISCAVIAKTNHGAKDQRILSALEVLMAGGLLHVHNQIWQGQLISQMRNWQPHVKAQEDDGLDALACAIHELQLRRPALPLHHYDRRAGFKHPGRHPRRHPGRYPSTNWRPAPWIVKIN